MKHAVGVSSWTAGAFLAPHARGIGPGNEVMVPSAATLAHIAFACPGPVPGAPAKLKDGWSYFKQSLETIGCSPVGRRQTLATAVAASSTTSALQAVGDRPRRSEKTPPQIPAP